MTRLDETTNSARLTADAAGLVTALNAAAVVLTGCTPEEATGKPVSAVLATAVPSTLAYIRTGAADAPFHGPPHMWAPYGMAVLLSADAGRTYDCCWHLDRITDDAGILASVVILFADVSAEAEARRQRAWMAERLLLANTVSGVGTYDLHVASGAVTWSDPLYEMAGVPRDTPLTGERVRALVHPADQPAFEAAVQRAVHADGSPAHDIEFRIVRPEGTLRWFRDRGCRLNADGASSASGGTRVVGTVVDITEQKLAEERLRESEARIALVLRKSHVVAFTMDRELRYTWITNPDPRFEELELLGRRDDELMPSAVARQLVEFKQTVLDTGVGARGEIELDMKGSVRAYDVSLEPLVNSEGQVTGLTGVVSDITERKQQELALTNADHQKNVFLATLGHELRNPLHPLASSVEIVRQEPALTPAGRAAVGIVDRQLKLMVHLVDDLLEVGRIAHNKLTLRRETVSLQEVITHSLESCEPAIRVASHTVQCMLPASPILVHGDRLRLEQVFINILSNACKYMHDGGTITLAVTQRSGRATVSVTDTGIGVDPAAQETIFRMFSQAASGVSEGSNGGLGVGLGLAHRITELHGGSIRLKSDGVNCGSTFHVELPTVRGATEAVNPAPGRAVADVSETVKRVVPAERVLVVDDNVDGAETMATLLRLHGYEVEVAFDGVRAVEMALAAQPTLILMDVGLPGQSGHEACRAIRAQSWDPKPLIVAATGYGQSSDRDLALAAGFDEHLVKPVELTTLLAMVNTLRERS